MTYHVPLTTFLVLALGGAFPDQQPPRAAAEVSESTDLMGALRLSRVAEIYIVSRNFEYPVDLSPFMVRSEACEYRLSRLSPEWNDLERLLAEADIRIVPTTARRQEVRFGMVLGDELGTIFEICSNDLDWPNGRRPGVSQRRRVEISPGFVTALRAFADRHPDLAVRSRNCPPAFSD